MNGVDPSSGPNSWEDWEDIDTSESIFSGITMPSNEQSSVVSWDCVETAVQRASSGLGSRSDSWPSSKTVVAKTGADSNVRFISEASQGKHTTTRRWGSEEGTFINGEYVVNKKNYNDGRFEEGLFNNGVLVEGKKIDFSKNELEGSFNAEGRLHGKGKRTYSDGRFEEGSFDNGALVEGKKIDFLKNELEGSFNAERRLHGKGKRTYSDGRFEQGLFDNGAFVEGKKIDFLNNQLVGKFNAQGNLEGPGEKINVDGRTETGMFSDGNLNGQGFVTYPDGGRDEGAFKDGWLHGEGQKTFSDGRIYIGQFIDGMPHGCGQLIYPEEGISKGDFFDGHRVDSNISEIGSVQFFYQLFELRDGGRDLGDPLGIVVDFLEKDGFEKFSGLLREVHQRLKVSEKDRSLEAGEIYSQLMQAESSKLLAYGFREHAMGLKLRRIGKFIYCEIYNSGDGLRYHEYDKDSGKYQTLMLVKVPIEHFNQNLIESLLNYRKFENAFQAYDKMLGLPGAQQIILEPEDVILQADQHTDNCTLEWIFAYLRNVMPQDAYYEMRFQLFKKCIEEVQKSEEGRQLLAQHSGKVYKKLECKKQRCAVVMR